MEIPQFLEASGCDMIELESAWGWKYANRYELTIPWLQIRRPDTEPRMKMADIKYIGGGGMTEIPSDSFFSNSLEQGYGHCE